MPDAGTAPPVAIRKIDHLALRMAGPGRTERFHREVPGCTVERRQEAIGLVQLGAGSALVGLVPVDGKPGMDAAPSIYLQDPEGNTIELKGPPAS